MILILLTKMIGSSGILFGYYWLFLRNKKFHHYNRFYLLGATLVSIVFPFLKIPVSFESQTATTQLVTKSIGIISVNRWEDEFGESGTSELLAKWLTMSNVLLIFYLLIVFALLCMLLRSLIYLHRLSTRYPFEQISTFKFYNTTEPGTPFSFFRSIFWNNRLDINSREGQQIFRHELFHVKQQHSADIIFLELICMFCWLNPFFHLVKKEIKAIHEFLADQYAIDDDNQHAYAELLILQSMRLKKSFISNYFFQNHIKRRITMITNKTKKYSYWSRLLVLPLGILLFCAIALYAQNGGTSSQKRQIIVPPAPATQSIKVMIDAGHGGEDAGARSNGLQEKDLSLAIARQIKKHASSFNVDVAMTRDEDIYPTLKERSALAASVKADLIVSIHVGGAEEQGSKSGFDIYVTNRNQETVAQSKLLGENIAAQIKNLYEVGPIKQRKEKGIWILDAAPCPAVLIECGFLTNQKDIAFITNVKNQEQVAKSILDGIVRYQRDKGFNVTDTIPNKKKTNESANNQLDEKDADAERKRAADEKLRAQRREIENAQRKIGESQRVIQKQREIIRDQQRDLQSREARLSRETVTHQQKQQDLARKHSEMETRQETSFLVKQNDLESRQRLIEQKIENQSHQLERIQELERRKHSEQEGIQEKQKRQQILLEQQKELDKKQNEPKEAEIRKIEETKRK